METRDPFDDTPRLQEDGGMFSGECVVELSDAGQRRAPDLPPAKEEKPASRPAPEPTAQDELAVQDAYFAGLKPAGGEGGERRPEPMRFITLEDAAKLESGDYAIKRLFPAQGVAMVFGEPACFKSFTVLAAAVHISEGWTFGGRRVRKRPVYYLALEGAGGLGKRIQAFKAWTRKTGKPELKGDFRFWTHGFALGDDEQCDALIDAVLAAGHRGAVIVIDTLSQATLGLDENSSQMAEAVGNATRIADAVGGLVLLIHHVGKNPANGPRGHSSLMGNVDCAVFAHKDGKGKMQAGWTVHKAKDDAEGQIVNFKIAVFELGLDSDGETVTSCAAEAFEQERKAEAKAPYGGLMKAESNAAKAFEAFREAATENGSGRSATLEEWRAVYYRNSTAEPNSKRSQFNTDRKTLVSKGILRVENDVYTVNEIVVQGFDEWL